MADLILYNGTVRAMDSETSPEYRPARDRLPGDRPAGDRLAGSKTAEFPGGGTMRPAAAVAVSDGLIQAVGTDEEILKLADENSRVIDLKGACVVPGFNDSHCHLLTTGIGMELLDLRGAASLEELIERGRRYIEERQIPEGTWVHGIGYDQNLFAEKVLPDGKTVDAISEKHPIFIERICGHVGAANAMAMKLAGYTKDTEVTGGELEKDADGRLTGVLKETALEVFVDMIPRPGVEETKALIEKVAAQYNACGVTSVHTDDLGEVDLDTMLEAYRQLEREGRLNLRIFEEIRAPRLPELNRFLQYGLRTGDGTDYFRIGNIKLFADGSLGARTAYMREDYGDDPGNRGIAVYTQEELNEVVMTAHKAGMQVACHAIGDGAVEQCVNAFVKARRSDGKCLRDRVVHCQFADDELLRRMADNEIASDIQPPFTVSDAPMVPSRLGDREWCGYRWKTMMDMGIKLGGGSDSPVEPFDVIWGIHCVVNRTDAFGNKAGVCHPEEKLTVQEALGLYTAGSAYLSFDENKKGRIKEGYLADLAILSQDILAAEPEDILKTKVLMTVVGGRIVYGEMEYEGRNAKKRGALDNVVK